MTQNLKPIHSLLLIGFGTFAFSIPLVLHGQPEKSIASATPANRLTFNVVQSFDAKYDGDTPGHLGRAGGLEKARLNVALGDPIYRGDTHVGSVTGLTWNRTNSSLDIEFDPAEKTRIAVGEEVWMAVDGRDTAKPK